MRHIPLITGIFLLLASGISAQNEHTTLRAKITYPGQTLANVWGYAADGREYALVGAAQGMIVVDITNPDTPVQIVQIPGPNNLWKEIKTYQHYAYVVSEGGMGVQIIDLSPLPSPNLPYHSYYGNGAINNQLNKAHALHIDETKGFLYLYGTNLNGGTPYVIDLKPDPYNPNYAGRYTGIGYAHDGYADNDTMYSCHIYAGQFAVVDMTDKLNPVLIATQTTPGVFPHNTWLSDDHRTLFATDEVSNSVLSAYDISDPTDIQLLDVIQSNPGSNSIVHNTEILNNYAVTSWYRDGFTIVDASHPDNLVQVGNFDTYNGSGSGFQGCWGVYPYFPSGTIIASNISAPGSSNNGELFIITPEYVRACRLEGLVTDAISGQTLSGATVKVPGITPQLQELSGNTGIFKMGTVQEGFYIAEVSKPGYQTLHAPVLLEHGVVTELQAPLFPEGSLSVSGQVIRWNEGFPIPDANIYLYGKELTFSGTSAADGTFAITGVQPGVYDVAAGAPGYGQTMLPAQLYVSDTANVLLELVKGHRRGEKMPATGADASTAANAAPNPFRQYTLLSTDATQPYTIKVYDLDGRLVETIQNAEPAIRLGMDWPPGVYFAHIQTGESNFSVLKIVKIKS